MPCEEHLRGLKVNDFVAYSVVVPVYGSELILRELHERLTETLKTQGKSYEIVFVDDCGPGSTWAILQSLAEKDSHTTAIQLMRNFGQGSATLCGMAHSRGQVVVTIDDDLQSAPEDIPLLLRGLESDVDVVMGVPAEKQHSLFRRLGSHLVNEMNALFLGKPRDLRFTSFRAIRRPVVDALLELRALNPVLGVMLSSVTRRIANVTVPHYPRRAGKSGYTLARLLRATMSNFIGQSVLPLRLLGVIGGFGIIFSVLFSVYLLCRYFLGGIAVPGWMTTTLLLLFLSGFNFFAFAVIGEYVLRILQRVNATPQYFVRRQTSVTEAELHGGYDGGSQR
ncbi:dolichol-phosphate mannosyltransferase/undecaprenyl-phosphate 4-deoxy-4-formamido-L-arabinose transferase [Pseudomonas citronellolis]|uniref:Dolichol-phosphate mannosyltransferase/undecaprenyl-phosphate 4-deoxy-4-formamido-L-arabinose transferase n=1 Tax=Pseudomonas citronellolis TaxID=53408 RepID=A0AAQ1HID1_9PSED|nr:glycosyltransferase [Pseudomonas citronellolis]SFB88713.1 dolichol-phosphate mannosyltransferase/undecaprenyl-phosphate 4-deoxy-4-formamido-L-arabinose transferase [Pseudomonas citronellolis]